MKQLVPKYKIGDNVNYMLTLIESYIPMVVKDIKLHGLIFKHYKYLVVNEKNYSVKWATEKELFKC